MNIMPNRDKLNNPIILEGKNVILHEICPDYFEQIILWRNDANLNRYLNQSFELTMEKEWNWFENDYLIDQTQGYMVMIDKERNIHFGTIGWTDYDAEMRRLVEGRVMRALPEYRKSMAYMESYELLGRFLYQYVDIMYAHVVRENVASMKLHKRIGFIENSSDIVYPNELIKDNMRQIEFFRTKERFYKCELENLGNLNENWQSSVLR